VRTSARPLNARLADLALGIVAAIVFTVLYAPIVLVVLFSLVPFARRHLDWTAAGLRWYVSLAHNTDLLTAVRTSLLVGVDAVSLALLISLACAFYVRGSHTRGRLLLEVLITLPFLLPPIITGLSLLVLFQEIGVERGLLTIVLGHTAFLLALTYRIILTRLEALPPSLVEASADLGATFWQTLRHVLFPQIRSALIAAALLAFTLSLDETLITVFLSGDQMTLPIRLWAMMRVGFTPEVNAVGTLVLLISSTVALSVGIAMRRRGALSEEEP
jgi:ABC-type spermidine/putrescine transport system permease subunit II